MIIAAPTDSPATTPVEGPILSIAAVVLQTPPGIALVSVTDEPVHTEGGPEIAEGAAYTVNAFVAVHPVAPTVYVILAVPEATPAAIPVAEPIVTNIVALLLHMPPGVVLTRVVAEPAHI